MIKSMTIFTLLFAYFTIFGQMQRANAITANLENIEFALDRPLYTTSTPTQFGIARRSEPITIPGLYKINDGLPTDYIINLEDPEIKLLGVIIGLNLVHKNDATDTRPYSIYNVGNRLPLFKLGESYYTYIRSVKDFYNDRNYVWAGNLAIQNDKPVGKIPSAACSSDDWIPENGIDATINNEGKMTKIFRKHSDRSFTHYVSSLISGTTTPLGAIWRNGKVSTSWATSLSISSTKLDTSRPAKIVYSLYDSVTPSSTPTGIKIKINDGEQLIYCNYTGKGQKLFTAYFPSEYLLSNPDNVKVVITNTTSYAHVVDFFEIHVPVLEEGVDNNEGYSMLTDDPKKVPNAHYYNFTTDNFILPNKLMVKVDEAYTGDIRINGARLAVTIPENVGEETLAILNSGLSTKLAGQTVYFASTVLRGNDNALTFDKEKNLTAIRDQLTSFQSNYLAILPSDYNYFLQLREKLFDFENDKSPFVQSPLQDKIFASNLYETWQETNIDGKTINDIHSESGITPLYLKLEDIIDTYGCGLYSPEGIKNLLAQKESIEYVCLVSGTTADYKKQDQNGDINAPFYVQAPGVPCGFFYGNQVGIASTDDIYCNYTFNSKARMIGRVVVYTDSDLTAWLKRRIAYKPSDTVSLWSGVDDDGISFSQKQQNHLGKIPTTVLDLNELEKSKMNRRIMSSFEGGITTGIYQGHGAVEYLDNSSFFNSKDSEMTKPGCFIWATCNAGKFFFEGYDEDVNPNYASLIYHYMSGKVALKSGNTINTEGDEKVGAVNAIAASGLAAAYWEDQLVGHFIDKLRIDKDTTWGEMFRYGKQNTSYNENAKVYHLFGDPAMKVRGENPRSVILQKGNLIKDTITLTIKGDWATNSPTYDNNLLKIKYGNISVDGTTSWVKDELTPINTSLLNQDLLMSDTGIEVVLDIKALGNVRIKVYSEHSSGVTSYEPFETVWCLSNILTIDTDGPTNCVVNEPIRYSNIYDNRILCKARLAVDTPAGVAGYQFILIGPDELEIESNSKEQLLTEPTFIFHPSQFPEMIHGEYKVTCRAFDNLGNSRDSSTPGKIFSWREGFDDTKDINLNEISDDWENYYFGSTDFIESINQDSNGDGVTDVDAYKLGVHPYNFSLTLNAGWNLISIPCAIEEDSILNPADSKLKEIISHIDSVWLYNASNQRYTNVNTEDIALIKQNITPLNGFWAFCLRAPSEPITFSGKPVTPSITVAPEWNLIGPASSITYNSQDSMNSVNKWDIATIDYIAVATGEQLIPATGYWIYNSEKSDQIITVK